MLNQNLDTVLEGLSDEEIREINRLYGLDN